jgi:glutaminyl-tRNA synthetase
MLKEIIKNHVTYDEDSRKWRGGSFKEKLLVLCIGFHYMLLKLKFSYDRLFIDEAPDSHKEKISLNLNTNS